MRQGLIPLRAGSSSRMRGALEGVLEDRLGDRIILADAGSTLNGFPLYGTDRDHPRGCGEHQDV